MDLMKDFVTLAEAFRKVVAPYHTLRARRTSLVTCEI